MSRRIPEKKAQTATNRWWDSLGLLRTTMTLRGRRGWPDEVYWVPGGSPLLIEFKAIGEEPRKLQAHIHSQLKKAGYVIEVHTVTEEAIDSLKVKLKAVKWPGCRFPA